MQCTVKDSLNSYQSSILVPFMVIGVHKGHSFIDLNPIEVLSVSDEYD